jgi:hypothetical protein
MDGGGRTLTYVCRTAQENKENEEKEGEEKWQDKRKQVNRRAALRKIRGAEYSQVRCTAPPAVIFGFWWFSWI